MAVTSPASLTKIRAEFDGPTNLTAYVRGGTYVPSTTANANIATAAASLKISQFVNAAKPTLSASPTSLAANNYSVVQTATMTTGTTTVSIANGAGGSFTHTWSIVSHVGTDSRSINPSGATCSVTAAVTAPWGGTKNATVVIRDTVTSGNWSATIDVSAAFTKSHDRETCVAVESFLSGRQRAGNAKVGDTLRVTDPYGEVHGVTTDAHVRISKRYPAQCYRIECANGAWLVCSKSAPIPTMTSGFITPANLLGLKIPTTTFNQLKADQLEVEWSEVVDVKDMGMCEVQLLFVEHQCFWASGDGRRYILHHNAKVIP